MLGPMTIFCYKDLSRFDRGSDKVCVPLCVCVCVCECVCMCMYAESVRAAMQTGARPFLPFQCIPSVFNTVSRLLVIKNQSSRGSRMRGRMEKLGRTEIRSSANLWNLSINPGRDLWDGRMVGGMQDIPGFFPACHARIGSECLWNVGPLCPTKSCHHQKFSDIWKKSRQRRKGRRCILSGSNYQTMDWSGISSWIQIKGRLGAASSGPGSKRWIYLFLQ